MDDNTKVLIRELMEDVNINRFEAEKLNMLIATLLDGAHLDYDGKSLRVGNDEVIMAFVKAFRPLSYFEKLEELQKEKENKNGK